MFDNFENQPSDYIPNNMFRPPIIRRVELNDDSIHPIYRRGRLFAYWWNWGDDISLEVKNNLTIYLPDEAIVSNTPGFEPSTDTEGDFSGQKYYNLVDLTSFTLSAIIDSDPKTYIWEKDAKFTYQSIGKTAIEVELPKKENEQFVVQLLDFRNEKVKEDIFTDIPFTWTITPEESLKIHQGIYTLNIHSEIRVDDTSTRLRLRNSYPIFVMFNGFLDIRNLVLFPSENSMYASLFNSISDIKGLVTADQLATVAFTGMWNDLGQDGDVILEGDGYNEEM